MLQIVDIFLTMIIIPKTIWTWKLAMNGVTQVEYETQLF